MYIARVPPPVTGNSDSTLGYLYMQNDMGLDCSVYAVTHQYERKQYMRYSTAFIPYGFQVVGPRPAVVPDTLAKQMFRLLTAFDNNVWLLTVASILVSGPLMTFFESGHGRSDFSLHRKEGVLHQVGQGMYLSAMGLSEHAFFTSVTPAGRSATPQSARAARCACPSPRRGAWLVRAAGCLTPLPRRAAAACTPRSKRSCCFC